MDNPLISIIIPVYNSEQFLSATLESVLQQTYSHFEIMIIDDGSLDNTSVICKKYSIQDARIHYRHQMNRGPAAARNVGIAAAKGNFICLLDGDDCMHPQRLEMQLAEFRRDPSIDVVYTALQIIDEKGKPTHIMHSREFDPANFLVELLFRNPLPWPMIMAKADCLIQNPFDEHFRYAEDYELIVRLAQKGYRFKYIDAPLTYYRRHSKNVSNNLSLHRKSEQIVLARYHNVEQIVQNSHLSEQDKLLMQGKILLNQEHWQEALAIFRQLNDAISYFYQGNCYFYLKQYELAIKAYQHSLQMDAINAACHNNLGVLYQILGNRKDAEICYLEALRLKPDYLDSQYNLSHLQEAIPRLTLRELRSTLLPYK
jgi:glycosyltransferase involved in cell wall biosynthesis